MIILHNPFFAPWLSIFQSKLVGMKIKLDHGTFQSQLPRFVQNHGALHAAASSPEPVLMQINVKIYFCEYIKVLIVSRGLRCSSIGGVVG